MNEYVIEKEKLDSVDLKCLLVSRGVKIDKEVYKEFSGKSRLDINPLTCNCMYLSDQTIVQLTDMNFHLRYLTGILSWGNLKLLKYASQLKTPFSLTLVDGKPALLHNGAIIDFVSFMPYTDYYKQKTSSGLPFIGNTVLQGCDWVAFQCLWLCEHAALGKFCEFCFSGGAVHNLAAKGKKLPPPVKPSDVVDIVNYAIEKVGCNSIQITGGSTFDENTEPELIRAYLTHIEKHVGRRKLRGEILLYITPPADTGMVDSYFELGADRIACSLELWDESKAKFVTPGNYACRFCLDAYGPPGSGFHATARFVILQESEGIVCRALYEIQS